MRLVVTAAAALGAASLWSSTALAGDPAPTQPARATASAPAPRPPAGLTASLRERSRVHLAWVAPKGEVEVARYEVLRGEQVVATATGTRADTAGPGRGRRYCYTVRAVGASGRRSQRSNLACVTRDVTPPTAPTRLTAAGRPGEVVLRWDPATDDVEVAGYVVLRGGRVVARTADTAATEPGLRAASEYCYAVVAIDAAGNESKPSATACATPPDVTAPTPPQGFAIEPPSGPSVVLSWAASSDDVGVAGYEVLRDGVVVATVNGTKAVDARADQQAESCYTVRAFDAEGNRSAVSDQACFESPDRVARGPANLHAEATSSDEVILHWDPPPRGGAAAYVVYWERDGDRRVATTPLTTLKVFGQAARERHCYRVAAQDENERESSKTAPVCTSALIALSAR